MTTHSSYKVVEQPMGTARPIRIITIGAGASGLNVARNVKEHMQNVELQIYEKDGAVGGTWLENSYPGCACDIPSHNYQYSWEPNPTWTDYYASQPEILAYFTRAAEKHGLLPYVRFGQRVTEAVWHEDEGLWRFQIEDVATGTQHADYGHFFINASGYLNNWKWPAIDGLHSFGGTLLHSAAWDDQIDLHDKTVAVIGYGSSGIQVVTALQPVVKHLTTFIRGPTWITAGFGSKYAAPGGLNFAFSDEQKQHFASDPAAYLAYRKGVEHELSSRFRMLHADTPEQAAAVAFSRADMRRRLGVSDETSAAATAVNPRNKALADFLIPDFPVGCRRPSPGNGYLEALSADNVRVITGTEIVRVEPDGLVMAGSGEKVAVDVIVCATGFDLSFRPRFPIVGRGGVDLSDAWAERPTAYLSMTPADMPNYFMFLGPNAPVGHGSAIPIIEHLTKYMLRMVHKAQTEGYRAFCPRPAAIDEFVQHADAFLPRTAWAGKCRSWFKNGRESGPVTGLHPGSRLHWFHLLREPRYEDWDWTSCSPNRWAYLGNGFSVMEAEDRDLTWYFDAPEKEYEAFVY
ncbi:steroid monooxygenase-like protein [Grosmannia clavigera kw1407]|uniref:Steroid monooxygenase-like protein n=1 Tax=Grosmannia clavigera (strain kw1407 / UAMH 11150) TaxID=655863 RepID=F0XUI8_GROCL|nr:steroid monooxygenase-like protein [Grosmannia clavigera kw1407]EFW98457.1 steroid monooxygenase-like protein [Grosmannia clavigera kw1407]